MPRSRYFQKYSIPAGFIVTIQRETTRREKEKERSRRIDRSGWLKSCRVFAAARRAWGVQWAMRGCVSAHVGALSTPDCARPLDRHVPRILQTYLHASKLSPDRTYAQVQRLSLFYLLSFSLALLLFFHLLSFFAGGGRPASTPRIPPSLAFTLFVLSRFLHRPCPRHHRDKNEIYGLFRGHLSLSLSFSHLYVFPRQDEFCIPPRLSSRGFIRIG